MISKLVRRAGGGMTREGLTDRRKEVEAGLWRLNRRRWEFRLWISSNLTLLAF